MNKGFQLLLTFFVLVPVICQGQTNEYFITANGNLYIPINTPGKGMYPILGYDKESDPKFLIGGLGIGFTGFRSIKKNIYAKGQANLSKHTYWDTPLTFRDINNSGIGTDVSASSDFTLGVTTTLQYSLTEKFSVGTGLGAQFLLTSVSRMSKKFFGDNAERYRNRYYKFVMPVIPIDLSLKMKKHLVCIRYEHALLNRNKKNLARYVNDYYSLLTFEVGFRI